MSLSSFGFVRVILVTATVLLMSGCVTTGEPNWVLKAFTDALVPAHPCDGPENGYYRIATHISDPKCHRMYPGDPGHYHERDDRYYYGPEHHNDRNHYRHPRDDRHYWHPHDRGQTDDFRPTRPWR